jgi:hemolysin III
MSIERKKTLNHSLENYLLLCKEYEVEPYPSAQIVFNNPQLTDRIHLGKDFDKGGLLPLVEVLKENKTIKVLDFRGAKIGSTGCIALRDLLEKNQTITSIDLTENRIDHHGIETLSHALKVNKTLKNLILRGNLISKQGSHALAKGLKSNTILKHVDVSNCFLGYQGSDLIAKSANKECYVDIHANYVREEAINSFTHFFGIVFSLFGGYFLIDVARKHTWAYLIGCCLFAFSLLMMYTSSVLAHSFFFMKKTGRLFQLLDHASISVLIAGSNSPFLLVSFGHSWVGVVWFIIVWSLCAICIVLSYLGDDYRKIELIMFLIMGWVAVLGVKFMFTCVPIQGIILIFTGGIFYTVGTIFYVKGSKVPIYHAIWHIFVLLASICHYFAILLYVDHCDIPLL